MVYIRGDSWLLKQKQCIVPVQRSKLKGPACDLVEEFQTVNAYNEIFYYNPYSFKTHYKYSNYRRRFRGSFSKTAIKAVHEVEHRKTLFIALSHFKETFRNATQSYRSDIWIQSKNKEKRIVYYLELSRLMLQECMESHMINILHDADLVRKRMGDSVLKDSHINCVYQICKIPIKN